MLDAAAIETPKLLTTLILFGLGWVIGKQLTVLWSRRQKQNEQDLDAARDFMRCMENSSRCGSCGTTNSATWELKRSLAHRAGNYSIAPVAAKQSWSRRLSGSHPRNH